LSELRVVPDHSAAFTHRDMVSRIEAQGTKSTNTITGPVWTSGATAVGKAAATFRIRQ